MTSRIQIGTLSVGEFVMAKDTDRKHLRCILCVDGTRYECEEYVRGDGRIASGRASIMKTRGIRNLVTGQEETFAANALRLGEDELWFAAENLVRAAMRAHLDSKKLAIRWHVVWTNLLGQEPGPHHPDLASAKADIQRYAEELMDPRGGGFSSDQARSFIMSGVFVITPMVGAKAVGLETHIEASDSLLAEPSVA
ncbi:MAG TPA: hypothetical protein DEQ45_13485 [Agrobacterium sp.]|uniref:hypothetical protein n=1 Tax=Rhizobium sp. TaxID=391 RepID=UPI000EDE33D8|nr:hypothetical protein [Agrobacterium sp.]